MFDKTNTELLEMVDKFVQAQMKKFILINRFHDKIC